MEGIGVDEDFHFGARLLQAATDQGSMAAQHNLALCYLVGRGVDKDMSRAKHWLQTSSTIGHLGSQIILATCLMKDESSRAVELLERAVAQGHLQSISLLSQIYELGSGDIRPNRERHVQLLRLGSSLQDPVACFILGKSLLVGLNVTQDAAAGFKELHKAAALNNPDAKEFLAMHYVHGIGVEGDFDLAIELLQAAAEQGSDVTGLRNRWLETRQVCEGIALINSLDGSRTALASLNKRHGTNVTSKSATTVKDRKSRTMIVSICWDSGMRPKKIVGQLTIEIQPSTQIHQSCRIQSA